MNCGQKQGRLGAGLAFIAAFWFAGCSTDPIRMYVAPVDQVRAVAPGLTPGWQHARLQPMQRERYLLQNELGDIMELTFSELQGDGGGLVANVNRWRSQIGLHPQSEEMVLADLVSVDLGENGRGQFVGMTGSHEMTGIPSRTIGLIVPQGRRTLFFKMTGPPELVESQREVLIEFAKVPRFE